MSLPAFTLWILAGGSCTWQAARLDQIARPAMQIARLDHLVLTVADIGRTCDFYTRVLGMAVVTFGEGRTPLRLRQQKIKLDPADNNPRLVAEQPTPGPG